MYIYIYISCWMQLWYKNVLVENAVFRHNHDVHGDEDDRMILVGPHSHHSMHECIMPQVYFFDTLRTYFPTSCFIL